MDLKYPKEMQTNPIDTGRAQTPVFRLAWCMFCHYANCSLCMQSLFAFGNIYWSGRIWLLNWQLKHKSNPFMKELVSYALPNQVLPFWTRYASIAKLETDNVQCLSWSWHFKQSTDLNLVQPRSKRRFKEPHQMTFRCNFVNEFCSLWWDQEGVLCIFCHSMQNHSQNMHVILSKHID